MMHSIQFENKIKFSSICNSTNMKNYFTEENKNKQSKYYKEVEINGIIYKVESVITDVLDSEIEFGQIIDIISVEDEIYFYLSVIEDSTFDSHYHAYVAGKSLQNKLIANTKLPKIAPAAFVTINNSLFINSQYGL